MMNERQNAERMYARARSDLLVMIAFTAINIILLLCGSNTMMLFSATVPYVIATLGVVSESQSVMIVFVMTAGIGIAVYLLCWVFSKKYVSCMVTAMIFFIIDSIALVGLCVISEDFSGILDMIIHASVLYYLIMGVRYGYKLKKMPVEETQYTEIEY